ncbi:hypothetical protein BAE29_07405 [Acidithiobacillus caldus]|nr:hypothetical protein BAE29_07405 [Acidithiobacillus caldus]
MVSFPSLVVVAQNAVTKDHIGKPIFERVSAAWYRVSNMPDHDLGEARLRKNDSALSQFCGLHGLRVAMGSIVGKGTNTKWSETVDPILDPSR